MCCQYVSACYTLLSNLCIVFSCLFLNVQIVKKKLSAILNTIVKSDEQVMVNESYKGSTYKNNLPQLSDI